MKFEVAPFGFEDFLELLLICVYRPEFGFIPENPRF